MTNKEAKEIMSKVTFYWELGEQTLTQNQINEALNLAIKALEQKPCEDAISRADVKKYLSAPDANGDRIIYEDDLDLLPPVTPQQKIGHWILLDECLNSGYYCSECHKKVIKEGWSNTVKKVKYCPNCGARMTESEE